MDKIHSLFVYGSLRSGFKSPAYEYIHRYFSFVGDAKVKGRLYDLVNFSAGVPADNGFIIGELYTIKEQNEFGWAIGQLDDYEGLAAEPDEIQLFRRDLVEVFVNEQKTIAWVYWYNGDVQGRPVIESGDLLEYLQQKK
jgi:gamma-glutamylcyclotransferase (GGCT)/AIG2-like uncharacterized protein YtfP